METYGEDIKLVAQSEVYLTEPLGLKDQPWFHNQVVRFEVDPEIWSTEGFFSALLAIEGQMGRVRSDDRNEPRIIDLDILLYGDMVSDSDFLTLPHPRMRERAFMLHPLHDIAPNLVFPDGETLESALKKLKYRVEGNKIWQD